MFHYYQCTVSVHTMHSCRVEEETFEVAGLLIVLRLWRIIRIFNAWYALDRKEDETPKCSSYFGKQHWYVYTYTTLPCGFKLEIFEG